MRVKLYRILRVLELKNICILWSTLYTYLYWRNVIKSDFMKFSDFQYDLKF